MTRKLFILSLLIVFASNRLLSQQVDSTLYKALNQVYQLVDTKANKNDTTFIHTISQFIQHEIKPSFKSKSLEKADSSHIVEPNSKLKNQDSLKNVAFQFSFLPPVSSNGMDNVHCRNQFSMNMIAGYGGAVNGIEMAGFANVLHNEMHGIQLAGFTNITGAETEGIQLAGFCNVNQKRVSGIQLAGFSNVVSDSVSGVQLAGFTNVNSGSMDGFQSAGFANINKGKLDGFQSSGFVNTVEDSVQGVQISGFMNYAAQQVNGVQVAGFTNIASHDISGTQVSGFLNVCKRLNGVQVGFINYTDSLESGTPIGFLSIARKGGFRAFELGANETFPATIQWKTGSDLFYNLFSLGAMPGKNFYWGWGYGFGSNLISTGRFRMNLDLMAMHVNNGGLWTNHVNLLNKAHLGFTWQIKNHFAISAGPTFNVLVVNTNSSELTSQESTVAPWTVSDKMYGNTRVQMWPGAQVIIRF